MFYILYRAQRAHGAAAEAGIEARPEDSQETQDRLDGHAGGVRGYARGAEIRGESGRCDGATEDTTHAVAAKDADAEDLVAAAAKLII